VAGAEQPQRRLAHRVRIAERAGREELARQVDRRLPSALDRLAAGDPALAALERLAGEAAGERRLEPPELLVERHLGRRPGGGALAAGLRLGGSLERLERAGPQIEDAVAELGRLAGVELDQLEPVAVGGSHRVLGAVLPV